MFRKYLFYKEIYKLKSNKDIPRKTRENMELFVIITG